MQQGLIYVASPYSHCDPYVRDMRYRMVRAYTSTLLAQGLPAFSPIVYGHTFTEAYKFPINFEAWAGFNHTMLRASAEMHVLKLDGWRASRGITDELEFCIDNNIPVSYVEYPGYENL